MDKSFSSKYGGIKKESIVYLESCPENLRISIWNIIVELYFQPNTQYLSKFCRLLAKEHRKFPIDELSTKTWEQQLWLKEYYASLEWHEVYDLLEFIVKTHYQVIASFVDSSVNSEIRRRVISELISKINPVLTNEYSGYRFINECLCPISNDFEMQQIAQVVNIKDNSIEIVSEHIKSAIELLSKRPVPDYRNSIKESISALESIVKLLGVDIGRGISTSLNELNKKIEIHPIIKSTTEKLYGLASNSDGIRHALLDSTTVNFDEAKFAVVTCSAIVNYLISKSKKNSD